jgi:hypothetical protein
MAIFRCSKFVIAEVLPRKEYEYTSAGDAFSRILVENSEVGDF